MPDLSLILAVLMGVVIAFFVLFKPLFLEKEDTYFLSQEADAGGFSDAVSILEMIAELDADYQTGKVSRKDYETLSLDYKHRYLKAREAEKR